ncbi:hypothetical protein AB0L57_22100 [Nocardia sp. NPDC052254]|uniref:hypothetical protein n=1 Tax=Nocardia sp. NPDC052254 TaxID=3155681 RepID=UPI0034126055
MSSDFPSDNDIGPAPSEDWSSAGLEVAVVGVSDHDGMLHGDRAGRSSWAAMQEYTDLLNGRTALQAHPVLVPAGRLRAIADHLADLPSTVTAIALIGSPPAESLAVQAITASTECPLVITESDAFNATLTAAVSTALRRTGTPSGRGRLAVIGLDRAPRLVPVLLASGAGNLTIYHDHDPDPALRRQLADEHDIVIDLTAGSSARPGTVTAPDNPFGYAALALPGLLSALCGHGAATVTSGVLTAAAQAICLLTPDTRAVPDLRDNRITLAVAHHVGASLTPELPPAPHL